MGLACLSAVIEKSCTWDHLKASVVEKQKTLEDGNVANEICLVGGDDPKRERKAQ